MNKKHNYIDSTILGLNNSSEAHFKWLVKVLHFIANKSALMPELTYDDAHKICEFGQWIDERLTEERNDGSFLQDIHRRHHDIHITCRALVEAVRKGEVSDARFDSFENALIAFNASVTDYKTHLLQLRSSYDTLTGLPLRRTLDDSFSGMVDQYSQQGLYLLLMDIDHFKKINDNYGHLVGDGVLRCLALTLEDNVRKCETVYRYGGEEFIIVLHAATKKEACIAAERIRNLIARTLMLVAGHEIKITFTAGLTRIDEDEVLREVLERTDKALYHGKETGRNRCIYVDREKIMQKIEV